MRPEHNFEGNDGRGNGVEFDTGSLQKTTKYFVVKEMRQYKYQRISKIIFLRQAIKREAFGFAKGRKCLLNGHLNTKHAENSHINTQCPSCSCNNFFRIAEYTDKCCRRQLDHKPENSQCSHGNGQHAFESLADSVGIAGTVIITDDGLCPLTDNTLYGNPHHLLNGTGNRHTSDSNISAVMLKRRVKCNIQQKHPWPA